MLQALREFFWAAGPVAAGGEESFLQGIKEFFWAGGFFMGVNAVASVIALAIIVERVIVLGFRLNVDAGRFMDQVQKLVMTGNLDRAIKLCGAAPSAALSRVVRAGLGRANRGEQEVAKSLEEAVLEVTPLISRRIASLWSIANIATLLGLIGTITGLIRTFKSLGAVSADQKQILLSNGISEAMNNTAFGLAIAVTCIVAHLMLTSKSKSMIEEIEFNALRLENMLARRSGGESSSLGDSDVRGA
jgi:biopolymer transport protein ExbB/TolQ